MIILLDLNGKDCWDRSIDMSSQPTQSRMATPCLTTRTNPHNEQVETLAIKHVQTMFAGKNTPAIHDDHHYIPIIGHTTMKQ